VLVYICVILLVKLKQLSFKKSKFSLKLEKQSTKEEAKSAVYSAGIGLVVKCSKARPAQWIVIVTL